ncbi:MAG: DUF507 family protein [Nitrospirae bacterium]|nr:DUF507 family protein [Nitrospirota bacterium]
MRLSEEKVSHLAHVILSGLLARDQITPLAEEGDIRREIKRVIANEVKIAQDIDSIVKIKLHSYSKKIPEGSPEWEVLYQKIFREEAAKKGRT